MECHFNWQLNCSQSTLENLCQNLKDYLATDCIWKCQLHNLLGYVLQTQGSSDEALKCLRDAETMISEQGEEEQDCLLLVNQANLAWVHFLRGEMAESQACVEKVVQLEGICLAPGGCNLHPEIAGEKGWSLLKFERSHKKQAIECFKVALRGNPPNFLFHKGLALAYEKGYSEQEKEISPYLKGEIIEKLRAAKEMDENDVCVAALYLNNALPNGVYIGLEEALNEANSLEWKLYDSERLDGLNNLLYLFIHHFQNYGKAVDVAETMLDRFPNSTRAKKSLANCLKRKVLSLREQTEEQTLLANRAIGLYEDVNTPHSVWGRISLAVMHTKVGHFDPAEQIYQSLLNDTLSDAEKQLVYLSYGDHLYWERKVMTEGIDLFKRAVQIPLVSDERATCIKRLVSVVRYGRHEKCDEICAFLLDLLCYDCRYYGKLFLEK